MSKPKKTRKAVQRKRHQEEEEMTEEKRLRLLEQHKSVRHPTPPPGKFHKVKASDHFCLDDFLDEDDDDLTPFWEESE